MSAEQSPERLDRADLAPGSTTAPPPWSPRSGPIRPITGLGLMWLAAACFAIHAAQLGWPIALFCLVLCVGICVGTWIAGRMSVGGPELGLLPFVLALWALACLILAIGGWLGWLTFSAAAFPVAMGGVAIGAVLILFVTDLQLQAPPEKRGRRLALGHLASALGALVGCLASAGWLWLFPGGSEAALALLAVGLGGLVWLAIHVMPDHFIRFLVTALTRPFYRIEVVGKEHVPRDGPALIVINHTSFVDGNLMVSRFKRFFRFVVYEGHYRSRLLRWMGENSGQLPIDAEAPPREMIRALRQVSDALAAGELVVIFPEGGITRVGFLQPFQRGMEPIMKRAAGVPIIPGYIDGMWGSIFSFQRGKFFRKRPQRWWGRRPVTIKFGEPMPSDSSVAQVRQRILRLGAECWELRKRHRRPLGREFLRVARRHARRPCLADSDTPMMTYGTVLLRAAVLARLLRRRLGPAPRVGLFLPPSAGAALAELALSLLGKVPVHLNYTTGPDVLDRCIRLAGIEQVISSQRFLSKIGLEPAAQIIPLEALRQEVRLSDKGFGAAVRWLPPAISERFLLDLGRRGMDDLATIIFSSGSTGDPKGVMLTHHNVRSNIEGVVQVVDATETDVIVGVLPFFHSFGFTVTLWLPLTIGAASVYHYSPLDAEVVGRLVRQHRASVFLSTATFLRHYLRRCQPDDFRSLRLLVCGAEKLPLNLAEEFEKKFGVRPMDGYGCTELSPAVATNRPDVVDGEHRQTGHKPGTVGHPLPGLSVRIVDPESREPLPIGQDGILEVRGPTVMKGYLDRPDWTAAVIQDGWYSTGDIARLEADGFLTITDRLARFSKVGGEMVPHGLIEDAIGEVLGTTDRLCVVIGVPDERKGERLVVLHSPLPIPVDALWARLKDRLPPLWLPARSAFHEVSELPLLASGKVDLRAAHKLAMAQRGCTAG